MTKRILIAAIALPLLLISSAAYARHGYFGGGVIIGEPYYPYPPYYSYPYYAYPPQPVYQQPVSQQPYALPQPVATDNYYQTPQGQYCREYTHTVLVGGHRQPAWGHACREPDGSWRIID